jgi:hypothetical protein
MWWKWVIGGLLAAFGVGGTAYGYDQHTKRQRELGEYRRELARKEKELAELEARCGQGDAQVRALAAELVRLRRLAA